MALIGFVLRIILGVIFIYSSYSKFISLGIFEINLVDFGLASWDLAPIIARVIIGFEYMIGVYLVLGWYLKRFTLPLSISSLVIFTIILVYMLFSGHADKNCGCFGASIEMSPLQGILKNLVMIAMLVVVFFVKPIQEFTLDTKYDTLIYWLLLLLLSSLLFFTHPIMPNMEQMDMKTINYRPPLELLYSKKQNDTPKVDMRKGIWIAAFLSLKCAHCQIAAQKLAGYKKVNPQLPIYFILNGDSTQVDSFLIRNKVENIEHNLFMGTEDVMKLAGNSAPIIFWLKDGVVEKKTNQINTSLQELEDWFHKSQNK